MTDEKTESKLLNIVRDIVVVPVILAGAFAPYTIVMMLSVLNPDTKTLKEKYEKAILKEKEKGIKFKYDKFSYAFDEQGDGSLDKIYSLGCGKLPSMVRKPNKEEQTVYNEIYQKSKFYKEKK